MYQINFNKPVHVHFIGIGGISMSGLAEILLQQHFTVTGSDAAKSALTQKLEQLGATVLRAMSAKHPPRDRPRCLYSGRPSG